VTHRLVGKSPEGSRQRVGWTRTPRRLSPHARSEGRRSNHLQFLLTFGDRWCPLLSTLCLSGTDPARTDGVPSRLVADASGAPALRDQGSDRPTRQGKVDTAGRTNPAHASGMTAASVLGRECVPSLLGAACADEARIVPAAGTVR
jgi:hypothetical protein